MNTLKDSDLKGSHLIYWLVVTVVVTIATVLFIFFSDYQEKTEKINHQKHSLITDSIRAQIKYFDESLSMSARLFAFTGDEKWRNRYLDHQGKLKVLLAEADIQNSHFFNGQLFKATESASQHIKKIEGKVFNHQEIDALTAPLFDTEYRRFKQDYALRVDYFSNIDNSAIRLNQLQSQIAYIDEVLTMSARMAAFTGEAYWKERYDRMVIILDASFAEALERTNNKALSGYLTDVSAANDKLVMLEGQAFELVALGELSQAVDVLFGPEYQQHKDIYAAGIAKFSVAINQEVSQSVTDTEQSIQIQALVIFAVLFTFTMFIFYLANRVKTWERTLKNRNIELEKKRNELEIFSYSMSHDLKAPLKSIQGFSRRIAKYGERDNLASIVELNKHVLLNAEKLDKLVDDIMDIIKAEKIDNLTENVDFDLIAQNISSDIALLENTHNVEFSADFNHQCAIICHRHSLYQVLINLVSNAVKYAKADIDNAFVKIATEMDSTDVLKITVSDNGIGINESAHDKVFTMFFRESSTRSFGTGLGLYLVKKQIENMNGTISFSSSPDGTQFCILIPVTR